MKRWALSLHTYSQIVNDLTDLKDDDGHAVQITKHKEESDARKTSDGVDRTRIREKLSTCIDPLNPAEHQDGVMNIITGMVHQDQVNVDEAVAIGKKQLAEFESSWPEGFHGSIGTRVKTMSAAKKKVTIGLSSTFDTSLIYSRVMGVAASRDINLKHVFQHELAPVPTSMFDDNGEMRITKTKAVLKKKLQVEQSTRTVTNEVASAQEVAIIDGCAMLWAIHWPSQGTVQNYVDGFIDSIMHKLAEKDVYLVFDRYYDFSIKGGTRCNRAAAGTKQYKLRPDAPLPKQSIILTVTTNKVQLIEILCQQLSSQVQALPATQKAFRHKLVITGSDPTPIQVKEGKLSLRDDLKTSHEEADVIIVQHMVHLARNGERLIKVICDDTDVFLLLNHPTTTTTILNVLS